MKRAIFLIAALSATLAAAQTPSYLPTKGGTLIGPTDRAIFNPFRANAYQSYKLISGVNDYFLTGTIPGTSVYNYGQQSHVLRWDVMQDATPGCWGFQGTCYNTEHRINQQTVYINGGGGTNMIEQTGSFYSVGDHILQDNSVTSFGGAIDGGGPEGTRGVDFHVQEATDTWTGAVATGHGGAGQTAIVATCATDCGSESYGIGSTPGADYGVPAAIGQGLIVTDEQATVASGQIESVADPSGETPGTMTVNITSGASNLAVSTCEATLTSNLSPVPNPSGSGSQTLSFTVTDVSGTCTAGGLLSFAGTNHEQAIITSVTAPSGGNQTITANVRLYHESGSYVFENANSDAGLFADVIANHTGSLSFPVEVLGVQSISGSTAVMWYRYFLRGDTPANTSFPYGRMVAGTLAGTSASNTGGTVTVTISTTAFIGNNLRTWQVFNNASAVYLSGATNSAFNGACTNVTVSGSTLSCTQAASSGQTSASLSISVTDATNDNPYGNTRVNFYQGAAITDPQDYSAPIVVNGVSNPVVDGLQFKVEPNEMTLAAGDALVEHHSAPEFENYFGNTTVQNPSAYEAYGMEQVIGGIGASQTSATSNFAYMAQNATAASAYVYFGGTLTPPPMFVSFGLFSNTIFLHDPPAPGGSVIYSPNGPAAPSGFTDPNYEYALYFFKGNGNGNVFNTAEFFPYTNTMEWIGPQQFASLVNFLGGVQLATGHTYTRHTIVTASLTPAAVAANTCAAQTLTVSGVNSGDHVINRDIEPSFTAGLGLAGVKVTAANTVSANWCNTTAAPVTPASGTYTFDVEQ